jgi:hypothetical protein
MFASQTYDLMNFFAFLTTQNSILQQCQDNSDLLAILSRSLGVNMQVRWIGPSANLLTTGKMKQSSYYPAGRTNLVQYAFTYHQVGYFQNKVYDPSTRRLQTDFTRNMGLTLGGYMNRVFPNQGANYRTLIVSNLKIGDAVSPLKLGTNAGIQAKAGKLTRGITITGVGFDSLFTFEAPFTLGAWIKAGDFKITSITPTSITFDLDLTGRNGVNANSPIQIGVYKKGPPDRNIWDSKPPWEKGVFVITLTP